MKNIALVVPTIRENCLQDFIKRWNKIRLFDIIDLIVMEDNPKKSFDCAEATFHFDWSDIEDELGEQSWIIPRKSDAVRSFAYYKAWKEGYDYTITLDDDCFPCPKADITARWDGYICAEEDGLEYNAKEFIHAHINNFTRSVTRWFNTLNDVKPRGMPFYNTGISNKVLINHGLWTNVIDYDAPTQLVAPKLENWSADSRIVPSNCYYPMCGMNVAWKAEATVLMYHLLMGSFIQSQSEVLKKYPVDRFGDIWAGIFSKKIIDETGFNVSSGTPYIRYERASNPFTNLKKEANGLEINEKLWQYVDSLNFSNVIKNDVTQFPKLYRELGFHISKYKEFEEYIPYFEKLGKAMQIWSSLFE